MATPVLISRGVTEFPDSKNDPKRGYPGMALCMSAALASKSFTAMRWAKFVITKSQTTRRCHSN